MNDSSVLFKLNSVIKIYSLSLSLISLMYKITYMFGFMNHTISPGLSYSITICIICGQVFFIGSFNFSLDDILQLGFCWWKFSSCLKLLFITNIPYMSPTRTDISEAFVFCIFRSHDPLQWCSLECSMISRDQFLLFVPDHQFLKA